MVQAVFINGSNTAHLLEQICIFRTSSLILYGKIQEGIVTADQFVNIFAKGFRVIFYTDSGSLPFYGADAVNGDFISLFQCKVIGRNAALCAVDDQFRIGSGTGCLANTQVSNRTGGLAGIGIGNGKQTLFSDGRTGGRGGQLECGKIPVCFHHGVNADSGAGYKTGQFFL